MHTSISSIVQILLVVGNVVLADNGAEDGLVYFPTYFGIDGYPRIMTDIHPGSPAPKKGIPTVVDQGSANFWLLEKGAIVNYGSSFLGMLGPCNITAHPSYKYKASTTATQAVDFEAAYAYGGNGKIVTAYHTVNDTMQFGGGDGGGHKSVLTDRRVALANFTLIKQAADNCKFSKSFIYDHGILGLSRFRNPSSSTVGPSFRQDLQDDKLVKSSSMSMWFDHGPRDAKGNLYGTTLIGGVPSGKYKGDLVLVKPSPPKDGYVGYYVPAPSISTTSVRDSTKSTNLKTGKTNRCLVDSGTGTENLAIDDKEFRKAAGLVQYNGYPAFNGSCEDLAKSDASLRFNFPGLNNGKSVTIKVPLANYGGKTTKGHCPLAMELSRGYNCVLAAGFNTGMFMAVNDDENEIALAQGGVSEGATKGIKGLGKVTALKKGQSLKTVGAI